MPEAFQSLRDLLFPARVPLRDAAEGQKPSTPATPASPRIDVAAEAEKAAKRAQAPPPAAPAAPVKKKKQPGVAATMGSQLMDQ